MNENNTTVVDDAADLETRPTLPPAKRIVVADDDYDLVHFLAQRLASLGCAVIGVPSAIEAINVIHRTSPDLVVLDVNMPGGNGLSVCEMMATDPRFRTTPVIILTGRSDECTIRRCHDMLVYYVEKGGSIWDRIGPLVCELLHLPSWELPSMERFPPSTLTEHQCKSVVRRQNTQAAGVCGDALADAVFSMLDANGNEGMSASDNAGSMPDRADSPPWILCIDDDADFSDALRIRLEQHGVAVVRAVTGMEGYRMAFTEPASVILLDFNMPNGQGDYILDRLKSTPVTKDIPVFVVTGIKDKVLERRMLAMGASEYLYKPVDFDDLREKLSAHLSILAEPGTAFAGAGQ